MIGKFLPKQWVNGKVDPPHPAPHKEDYQKSLKDAWQIINVLHMELMDNKEAWPRALEWLENHAKFR